MEIRKAGAGDLDRILAVYEIAREYMRKTGNPDQWGRTYPPKELIEEDIRTGICHVIRDGGEIRGVFALIRGIEPNYLRIEGGSWLNDRPYLTIHRVASDGTAHGVFRCAADYCKSMADNVRIDTHEKNLTMQRQIEKNGFLRCGIIHLPDGSPRIAYQWTADPPVTGVR